MEALREELGLDDIELIRGHSGIFEVAVDGEVVAKKTMGRFPDEVSIVEAVRAAMG